MAAEPEDEDWEDDEDISEFRRTARRVIEEDFELLDALDE
jgi:hypothetical protein